METALKEQLWSYIATHNPDLMFDLQEAYKVSDYLEEKITGIMREVEQLLDNGLPAVTVQEICLEKLTEELKPSKFQYIREIFEQEFPTAFQAMRECGMLNYEVINMVQTCQGIFDHFGFREHMLGDQRMRNAVIGEISFYLS